MLCKHRRLQAPSPPTSDSFTPWHRPSLPGWSSASDRSGYQTMTLLSFKERVANKFGLGHRSEASGLRPETFGCGLTREKGGPEDGARCRNERAHGPRKLCLTGSCLAALSKPPEQPGHSQPSYAAIPSPLPATSAALQKLQARNASFQLTGLEFQPPAVLPMMSAEI
jgi:hypothetical protein